MSGRKANNHVLLDKVMNQSRNPNGNNRGGGQGASPGTFKGKTLETEIAMRLKTENPFAPIGETGRTILHLAAQLGDSDIVRDLLKRREAVTYIAAKDNGGETAIEIAKREGHTEVQDLLEAAGRGAA
uniref:Uncharacterized protein n=1 Tax=Opuntia streptacantha TaxID=393608 RepID=A0A7C9CZM2_OPUST